MFWLGEWRMTPMENFLASLTQFAILMKKTVPGNVMITTLDICRNKPFMGSEYMELSEKICILTFHLIL